MTVEDVRRAKLEELIRDFGSATALAKHLGISRHRIYQLKGRHAPFSDRTARSIEKKTGKSHGWMDGFAFSLDGVDKNLEQMLQIIVPMLQKEQIRSGEFYDPTALTNIVIVALKAMYIQIESLKSQGLDDETIVANLRQLAAALTPRLIGS